MSERMTKTAVRRIQVEERKAMRSKFRHSAFIASRFPGEVVADIWRRLVVGGRWAL